MQKVSSSPSAVVHVVNRKTSAPALLTKKISGFQKLPSNDHDDTSNVLVSTTSRVLVGDCPPEVPPLPAFLCLPDKRVALEKITFLRGVSDCLTSPTHILRNSGTDKEYEEQEISTWVLPEEAYCFDELKLPQRGIDGDFRSAREDVMTCANPHHSSNLFNLLFHCRF